MAFMRTPMVAGSPTAQLHASARDAEGQAAPPKSPRLGLWRQTLGLERQSRTAVLICCGSRRGIGVPEVIHVDRAHAPPSGGSRLCSNALPERDRVAIFREVYGRQVMRVDVEPLTGYPFQIDMAIRMLPGLSFLSCRRSPLRVMRTKDLISDGDDRVVLQMGNVDHVAWQCGREITLQA